MTDELDGSFHLMEDRRRLYQPIEAPHGVACRRTRECLASTNQACLGLAVLLVLAWFLIFGHHRQLLEITTQDETVRVISHRSPFQVFLPGKELLMPAVRFNFGYSDWRLQGAGGVVSQSFSGIGIIHSTEREKRRPKAKAKVSQVPAQVLILG